MSALPKTLQSPFKVSIDITNRCNLRCDYCYFYESDAAVKNELTTGEWLDFFDQLKQHRVVKVVLAGGEPFIRPDFLTLLQGVAQNRMRYTILTNGTLLKEPMVEQIAAEKRCDAVQISIDGHTASIHDSFRGRGSFEKAVIGIRLLQKYQVPVTVRCTIHKKNYKYIKEIAEFLLDETGLPSFGVNEAGYAGRCQEKPEAIRLGVPELTEAMDLSVQAALQYPGRVQANDGPLAKALSWTRMIRALEKQSVLPDCGILASCGCVYQEIAVWADGTIVPCSQLDLPLGNIKTHDLSQVFQNHPTMERLRQRRLITLDRFEKCMDCPYQQLCKGGCPASARRMTGHDEQPSPDSCLKLFLEQGGVLPEAAFQLLDA